MLLTFGHIIFSALIQTMIYVMFARGMKRLGKPRDKSEAARAFIFIVGINFAGVLTFGETSWQTKSVPVAAGFFVVGMAFFFFAHIYSLIRRRK